MFNKIFELALGALLGRILFFVIMVVLTGVAIQARSAGPNSGASLLFEWLGGFFITFILLCVPIVLFLGLNPDREINYSRLIMGIVGITAFFKIVSLFQ